MFGFVAINSTDSLRLIINTKPPTSLQARRALLLLGGRHGSSVLGDSLGALRDGVLGKLSGEDQADGRLDLPGAKGLGLGEAADVGGLTSDALGEVADEVAHDNHALGRDARVRVNLLEDLVDVARVGLLGLLLLLVAAGFLGRLGGLLRGSFGHFASVVFVMCWS